MHADSDNNGAGTCMSGSDLSSSLTPSAALNSMTPSTRRKHLLMMQHAQRSSMDTDALECEETAYEPVIFLMFFFSKGFTLAIIATFFFLDILFLLVIHHS